MLSTTSCRSIRRLHRLGGIDRTTTAAHSITTSNSAPLDDILIESVMNPSSHALPLVPPPPALNQPQPCIPYTPLVEPYHQPPLMSTASTLIQLIAQIVYVNTPIHRTAPQLKFSPL